MPSDNRDIRWMNEKRKEFKTTPPPDVTPSLVDAALKGECANGVDVRNRAIPEALAYATGLYHYVRLTALTVVCIWAHIPRRSALPTT